MADVHQVITVGIRTPSDIPHFILMGLSPSGVVEGGSDVWSPVHQHWYLFPSVLVTLLDWIGRNELG